MGGIVILIVKSVKEERLMKKVLNCFLSVILLANMCIFPAKVTAAVRPVTSLVNIISGGDFESGIPSNVTYINKTSNWYGELRIDADPFDGGDGVLRVYDSSTTEATGFLIKDISTTNSKLYIEADVLLESDSKADVFFSDDGGWYDYQIQQSSGLNMTVSTKIRANNTEWKRFTTTLEDDGDSNTNVWFFTRGKVPFFVDNLAIYDMANAYEIAAPAGVTVDPVSYTVVTGKNMTNAGDTVRFTVDAPMGYRVKAATVNGVEATAAGNDEFTFVMPSADASIEFTTEKKTHETTLVDVLPGGDMENGIPSGIRFDSWYGRGSIVEDPFDPSNKVLYTKGANSQAAGTAVMFSSIETTNKKWHIDARVLNGVTEHTDIFFTDAFGWYDNHTLVNTGNYVTVSNRVYASGSAWNEYHVTLEDDGDKETGIWLWTKDGSKPFYADDIRVYDVTNAYAIMASDEVTIDPVSYAVVDNKKMANAGDCVRITAPPGYVVYMDGEPLVEDEDGVFLMDMPERAVNITAEEPTLENLIKNGDFSDGTVGNFYAEFASTAGHTVTVTDGALKFTAENELPEGTTPLVVYPYNMAAGEKYFFTYKARKGEGMTAVEMYSGTKNGEEFSNYQPLAEDGTFNQYTTEFIPTADGSAIHFYPKAVDGEYSAGTYYIDDVELYNVTNAVTVDFEIRDDIEVTYEVDNENGKKVIIDSANNRIYAEEGARILFTVTNPEEGETIDIEDESVELVDEYTYCYTTRNVDDVITVGYSNTVTIESVSYISRNAVLYSKKDLECVVVAATFDSNGKTTKAVPIDVKVGADSTATIDLKAFSTIKGVKLFIWNSLAEMDPIIEAYEIQ